MYIKGEIELKNYKIAEGYIKKAIKTNKADGYAALGAMYRDMGKPKEAEKYLKLAIDNGSAIASVLLFQYYACDVNSKGNTKRAEYYKKIAYEKAASSNTRIRDIDEIFTNVCERVYDLDTGNAFSYTAKDMVNDYFSQNRYLIGIIPSVWESFIKKNEHKQISNIT